MRTVKRWAILVGAAGAFVACEAPDGALVGPPGDAAVQGRVAEATESFASGAGDGGARPEADAPSGATADAARVNANGTLTVIATASVQADGSYRIEGVPTGRSDLVVVARSATGVETGRVLLAGETRAEGALLAAPIDAETTVHALVYSELRAAGAAAADVSPAELELLLPIGRAEASALARSRTEVRALAKAYVEARETVTRAYGRLGASLSAQARQRLLLSVQAEHHARKHDGAGAAASFEAFLADAVDALAEAAHGADAVVLATAGARAAVRQSLVTEGVARSTHLAMARGAARLNLAARLRLLAGVPDVAEAEREGAADALVRARARVRTATSPDAVDDAMAEADARARQSLLVELTWLLAGLNDDAKARVEAAFKAALDAAELAPELRAGASAAVRAEVLARYRESVRAAARAYADTEGVRLEAGAAADLLIAARAG